MRLALTTLFLLQFCGACAFNVGPEVPPRPAGGQDPDLPADEAVEPAPPGSYVGFLLGYRAMDDDELWDGADDHFALAAELVYEPPGIPFGWEFGVGASGANGKRDGFDVSSSIGEVYIGARKSFPIGRVRTYIGGGLSFFYAETRAEEDFKGGRRTQSDDDDGIGTYLRAGVLWPVNRRVRMGLDYRVMRTSDVDWFRDEGDADSEMLSLVLATNF